MIQSDPLGGSAPVKILATVPFSKLVGFEPLVFFVKHQILYLQDFTRAGSIPIYLAIIKPGISINEVTSSASILPKHSDELSLVVPTLESIEPTGFSRLDQIQLIFAFYNVILQFREGAVHFINSSLFLRCSLKSLFFPAQT